MYKLALFPIHIFQNNIRENHILKDELLKKIEDQHNNSKLKIPEGWTTDNLFTSFSYEDLNYSLFGDTRTLFEYNRYVAKFFDLPVEFDFESIWFNHYDNGDWQEEHTHTGNHVFQFPATFSCIHFLKFDPKVHQAPIFVDPYEEVRQSSLEMVSNLTTNRVTPNVREGDIIMFPSYLRHFVPKGIDTPGNPRITIAFNIKVKKYGDTERKNS